MALGGGGDPALRAQLERFCRAMTSDPEARVLEFGSMGGHAGFSYGFDVEWRGGGRPRVERLVLRLAPPGVRAEGPADVVRQARLLEQLGAMGAAVAPVRWFGSDSAWFGTPYSVVERLRGHTINMDAADPMADVGDARAVARDAVRRLAELHALEHRRLGDVLGEPLTLGDDVGRWERFVDRSPDERLLASVPQLRALLLERVPETPRVGITHGDFQWSNVLIEDDRVAAILDWELAGVGAVLSDLGWLCLFSDPEAWAPPIALPAVPGPRVLVDAYAEESGASADEIDWFRALASYKFAIIAALNLSLHRRGKRPDPFYEELVPSILRMVARGLEVLGDGR